MRERFEKVFLRARSLFVESASVRFDEPMKAHTSLGIGGRAAVYVRPNTIELVSDVLRFAKEEDIPLHYVGGGTNMLVRDGRVEAVLVATGELKGIDIMKEDDEVILRIYAGEALRGLLSFCRKGGFSGLEALAGIPGSVGGAVKGNSGSFGTEIKDVISAVEVLSKSGEIKRLSREEMGFAYRGCALSEGDLVVAAEISLRRAAPEEITERMDEYFQKKKDAQPLYAKSAGCVFKNPAGLSAGKLIDEAGLKGVGIGGVEVSTVHANFFVNRGGGTAADFMRLMDMVVDRVKTVSGAMLEPEIRII
jgi:UDP-N-acetylmuramate dehydrogenase